MKKYLKRALVVVVAFVMILTCANICPMQTSATMSKSKQHNLYAATKKHYKAAMKKKVESFNSTYGSNYSVGKFYYAYVDIDKNGIDELVCRMTDSSYCKYTGQDVGYGECTNIYTIRDGKVKTVLNTAKYWNPNYHSQTVCIFKGSSYIDRSFTHGYDEHAFYKMAKGKLSAKANYSLVDTHSAYYINNKTVSKATYKSKLKSLSNGYNKGYLMKKF